MPTFPQIDMPNGDKVFDINVYIPTYASEEERAVHSAELVKKRIDLPSTLKNYGYEPQRFNRDGTVDVVNVKKNKEETIDLTRFLANNNRTKMILLDEDLKAFNKQLDWWDKQVEVQRMTSLGTGIENDYKTYINLRNAINQREELGAALKAVKSVDNLSDQEVSGIAQMLGRDLIDWEKPAVQDTLGGLRPAVPENFKFEGGSNVLGIAPQKPTADDARKLVKDYVENKAVLEMKSSQTAPLSRAMYARSKATADAGGKPKELSLTDRAGQMWADVIAEGWATQAYKLNSFTDLSEFELTDAQRYGIAKRLQGVVMEGKAISLLGNEEALEQLKMQKEAGEDIGIEGELALYSAMDMGPKKALRFVGMMVPQLWEAVTSDPVSFAKDFGVDMIASLPTLLMAAAVGGGVGGATGAAMRAAGTAERTARRAAGTAERTARRAAGTAERTARRASVAASIGAAAGTGYVADKAIYDQQSATMSAAMAGAMPLFTKGISKLFNKSSKAFQNKLQSKGVHPDAIKEIDVTSTASEINSANAQARSASTPLEARKQAVKELKGSAPEIGMVTDEFVAQAQLEAARNALGEIAAEIKELSKFEAAKDARYDNPAYVPSMETFMKDFPEAQSSPTPERIYETFVAQRKLYSTAQELVNDPNLKGQRLQDVGDVLLKQGEFEDLGTTGQQAELDYVKKMMNEEFGKRRASIVDAVPEPEFLAEPKPTQEAAAVSAAAEVADKEINAKRTGAKPKAKPKVGSGSPKEIAAVAEQALGEQIDLPAGKQSLEVLSEKIGESLDKQKGAIKSQGLAMLAAGSAAGIAAPFLLKGYRESESPEAWLAGLLLSGTILSGIAYKKGGAALKKAPKASKVMSGSVDHLTRIAKELGGEHAATIQDLTALASKSARREGHLAVRLSDAMKGLTHAEVKDVVRHRLGYEVKLNEKQRALNDKLTSIFKDVQDFGNRSGLDLPQDPAEYFPRKMNVNKVEALKADKEKMVEVAKKVAQYEKNKDQIRKELKRQNLADTPENRTVVALNAIEKMLVEEGAEAKRNAASPIQYGSVFKKRKMLLLPEEYYDLNMTGVMEKYIKEATRSSYLMRSFAKGKGASARLPRIDAFIDDANAQLNLNSKETVNQVLDVFYDRSTRPPSQFDFLDDAASIANAITNMAYLGANAMSELRNVGFMLSTGSTVLPMTTLPKAFMELMKSKNKGARMAGTHGGEVVFQGEVSKGSKAMAKILDKPNTPEALKKVGKALQKADEMFTSGDYDGWAKKVGLPARFAKNKLNMTYYKMINDLCVSFAYEWSKASADKFVKMAREKDSAANYGLKRVLSTTEFDRVVNKGVDLTIEQTERLAAYYGTRIARSTSVQNLPPMMKQSMPRLILQFMQDAYVQTTTLGREILGRFTEFDKNMTTQQKMEQVGRGVNALVKHIGAKAATGAVISTVFYDVFLNKFLGKEATNPMIDEESAVRTAMNVAVYMYMFELLGDFAKSYDREMSLSKSVMSTATPAALSLFSDAWDAAMTAVQAPTDIARGEKDVGEAAEEISGKLLGLTSIGRQLQKDYD